MITLNTLFQNGAVFQQKMPIPVWGNATPGNLLKAEFAGVEAFTKVAAAGNFMLRLPPVDAGGPFTLKITDVDAGESVVIEDVLVGEVWLASGQSNMEYQIGSDWTASTPGVEKVPSGVNAAQAEEYYKTIKDPSKMRFITVKKNATGLEEETFEGEWKYMNKENAVMASAVAAWFGRFVQEKIDVPVGLIVSAWGGTIAEAWTSRAGLLSNPDTVPLVYETDQNLRDQVVWERDLSNPIPAEAVCDTGNKGVEWGWAATDFNDSEWVEMNVPGSWIAQKISGNGALWVRHEVMIPPRWKGKNLILHMGGIDKQDVSYFNGVEIGGMGKELDATFWNIPRNYTIPADLVNVGKNVIAVRAYSFLFDGAFLGQKKDYYIQPEDGTEDDRIQLGGMWKAAAELDLGVICASMLTPGPGMPNTPGILFNSMIRPLVPYAIRGAIWYQGESNARSIHDSIAYERKLGAMIRDWRYWWGQGDFPFIQVQLANYSLSHDPEFVPASRWAVLRDVQRIICNTVPNVYMASAIDIGDLDDIHPQDKKSVGARLAANAFRYVYRYPETVPCGPLYQSCSVEDNEMRINFCHAVGLTVREDLPQSFYIAGKDRVFRPATSVRVEGNSVLISNDKVVNPMAVRYGWSDAAVSTVYNAAGFPASSFRTDDWDFYE